MERGRKPGSLDSADSARDDTKRRRASESRDSSLRSRMTQEADSARADQSRQEHCGFAGVGVVGVSA